MSAKTRDISDTQDLVHRLIRPDVQSLQAYSVQASEGLIKLDAMENPHRLPLPLQAELGARLGAVAINRYPGQRVDELKAALAARLDLPPGYGLMLGNGSDELIALLAMACDQPGASILAPEPGFVMYAMSAHLQGLRFTGVPLLPDFSLDVPALRQAMALHAPALVYLAYPNNPSANLWDVQAMREVIAAAPGLVVVDEAYQPFASRSWLDEIRAHPAANRHVLLMRTLSKFGLAGVRVGFLVGPAPLVTQVDKLRPPYNVSALNAECALFALEHAAVFEAQAQDIRAQRSRLQQALAQLPGVQVFPSEANMILLRVPDAARTFAGLKARGVLVKNVSGLHPLLHHCLRLTVGTPDENTQLLAALEHTL